MIRVISQTFTQQCRCKCHISSFAHVLDQADILLCQLLVEDFLEFRRAPVLRISCSENHRYEHIKFPLGQALDDWPQNSGLFWVLFAPIDPVGIAFLAKFQLRNEQIRIRSGCSRDSPG